MVQAPSAKSTVIDWNGMSIIGDYEPSKVKNFLHFLHFCTIYTIRTFSGKTQLFWEKLNYPYAYSIPKCILAVFVPQVRCSEHCVTQCPRSHWTRLGTSPHCNKISRVQTRMLAESKWCCLITEFHKHPCKHCAMFFSFLATPNPEIARLVEGKPSTSRVLLNPDFQ